MLQQIRIENENAMIRASALAVAVLSLSALGACASAPQLTAWDAVAAAPQGHTVLLENAEVRVLRVSIAPGDLEPIHAHGWPSVMYFEKPQPITYIVYELVDGKPVERERIEAPAMPVGQTEWMGAEGLHAIQNRGTEPFVALRVEMKNGAGPSK